MRTGLPVHPPWSTGFAPAVGVLTRLLQPLKAHLYSQGIKLSWYVTEDSGGAAGPGARGYSELRMKRAVAQDFTLHQQSRGTFSFLCFIN
jgi:hypothetical protein